MAGHAPPSPTPHRIPPHPGTPAPHRTPHATACAQRRTPPPAHHATPGGSRRVDGTRGGPEGGRRSHPPHRTLAAHPLRLPVTVPVAVRLRCYGRRCLRGR